MINNAIDVRIIENELDLEKAFDIRRQVFMGEQAVTEAEEFDGKDKGATHYLASVAGITAGTVRIINHGKTWDLQRLSILSEYRGFGVGRKIVERIISDARKENVKEIHLEAQTHALGFYQSFGFQPHGDEFLDARIPHRKMTLKL